MAFTQSILYSRLFRGFASALRQAQCDSGRGSSALSQAQCDISLTESLCVTLPLLVIVSLTNYYKKGDQTAYNF